MQNELEPAVERSEAGAIEDLILAHQSYARALAFKIAKRLPAQVDPEELAAYAIVGLTQAAQKFDPDLGVQFTTFSYYRIRGAVYDGVREMTWLPPAARRDRQQMELEDSLCENGLGEVRLEADAEELAREFKDVVRTLGAVFLLSDAGEEQAPEPVDETSAAEVAEEAELVCRVRTAIAELDEDSRSLVQALYFEGCSMTDLATARGVNKSTISRSHARAVAELKERLVA